MNVHAKTALAALFTSLASLLSALEGLAKPWCLIAASASAVFGAYLAPSFYYPRNRSRTVVRETPPANPPA